MFRLGVRIWQPRLNSLSTGALDGSVVLYFKNSLLLSGNLCRQSMSVEVSVRNMSTCALASVFSVWQRIKQRSHPADWHSQILYRTRLSLVSTVCSVHSVNRFVQQGTWTFFFRLIYSHRSPTMTSKTAAFVGHWRCTRWKCGIIVQKQLVTKRKVVQAEQYYQHIERIRGVSLATMRCYINRH